MSTRCQVLVEGADVIIYRHSDGYPDGKNGVLSVLLPLLEEFTKFRGTDPVYMTAQIVAAFIAVQHKWTNKMIAKVEKTGQSANDYRKYRYLGFGVESFEQGQLHGDLEYFYYIKSDHVEVRVPKKAFYTKPTLSNTKAEKKVSFDGKELSWVTG